MLNQMPEHDHALLVVGIILGLILLGMIIIEWLLRRDQDALLDEFADSAAMAAFDEECRRWWRNINEAEAGRQRHLDESEAAAIARQHQPQ